ncbi:uncharacterized protein PFL1_06056 [Pseudozyma flocculosa PF-1]|uniref:RING-type E3 ubiquitin transferase n=2 Tax=Pseudozyma flocculosa TaxID=84751 RepID=A0A5C3F3I8_9BASI|nr:uncharacterized protein PFL1_06056 [Pseudozyma flocculosa PF-1]EPQ26408.1 hypothetical protein PFL1_06056 [Pseudozyma flocculosa PF-1]SPO38998.1 related to HRD1 - ubiquitin-protein ligase [Pseudozyma flocculosa]
MPGAATPAITPERITLYGIASSVAAASVVFRAFRERSNFYAATVWLGRSNGCMLVLLNFVLFMTLVFGRVVQKIFFGQLRAIEIEHLYERSWYSLVDTLLAMAIFRDEFDVSFVLLFGTLLFLKAFHWLSGDRVEFMEQSPSVSRLFHVRMVAILWTLLIVDVFLVGFVVELLLFKQTKIGIMILFASEFITLMISLWSTIAKYLINCQDLRSDEPWEAKSMYIFYVDLCNDVLKLATHLSFFVLLTSWYGLPLSQIRDLYVTGRSCAGKIRDLIRYRAATKNMDSRYPDATSSDMRAMSDGTCIICREDMVVRDPDDPASSSQPTPSSSSHGLNMTPKRLPCGHIFHFHCLRSWLERQQSCPTCRRSVLEEASTAPPTGAAPPLPAAAPQPGAAPTPPPTRQAGGAANAQPGGSGTTPGAAAGDERADGARGFDRRLQEFLQRIQSDARRVRDEGNASARRAGRQHGRRTPRGDQAGAEIGAHSTPAASAPASASTSTTPTPNAFDGARPIASASAPASRGIATPPRWPGRGLGPMLGRSSLSQAYLPHADADGGLWVAPPPETLEMPWTRTRLRVGRGASRAENAAEPDAAGAAEAADAVAVDKTTETATEETRPEDESGDDDEEEAVDEAARARDHALKLNSWLDALQQKQQASKAPGSSSTAPVAESAVPDRGPQEQGQGATEDRPDTPRAATEREDATAPHLIPLFDPSRIPHFESVHVPSLPYQLLPPTPTTAAAAAHRGPTSSSLLRDLGALSDEDLQRMADGSRAGLEAYVRTLGLIQADVSSLVEQLTRVLSVDPLSNRGGRELAEEGEDDDEVPTRRRSGKGKAPVEGMNAV